jgi:hypothetical protein
MTTLHQFRVKLPDGTIRRVSVKAASVEVAELAILKLYPNARLERLDPQHAAVEVKA